MYIDCLSVCHLVRTLKLEESKAIHLIQHMANATMLYKLNLSDHISFTFSVTICLQMCSMFTYKHNGYSTFFHVTFLGYKYIVCLFLLW